MGVAGHARAVAITDVVDVPTAETDTTLVLAPDGAGAVEFRPEAPGVPYVAQDIGGDFTTAADSAWHDVTGLTGVGLTTGTWIALLDLECEPPGVTSFGPAFRIWDATTTYAQGGYLVTTPAGAISSHYHLASKPFVVVGSITVAVQVFSDTAFTIKRYPTRGGISTAEASHVTFVKVA